MKLIVYMIDSNEKLNEISVSHPMIARGLQSEKL